MNKLLTNKKIMTKEGIQTKIVDGRIFLLRESTRELVKNTNGDVHIPKPNFMGTGLALVGVLKRRETIDMWCKRVTNYENNVR